MGNFRVEVNGVGGHGCQRASEVPQEGQLFWCQRQNCPDCIAREFVEKLARYNISSLSARILHWPDKDGNIVEGTVVDEFNIQPAKAEAYKNSDGTTGNYVVPAIITRTRSKPM